MLIVGFLNIWPTYGYSTAITTYSVADAKNRLPVLIDRAIAGESVVITRPGHPVVELKPVLAPARRVTKADLEWLAARRIDVPPGTEDAGTLLRRMRDEEWR